MIPLFRVDFKKMCLVEVPTMEKPKGYDSGDDGWQQEWDDYNKHLESLRSIPYHNENDFEENKGYEEGRDFAIKLCIELCCEVRYSIDFLPSKRYS